MPDPSFKRRSLITLAACLPAIALAGCGFRLRGPQPLPFATIHVGVDPSTSFGASLRRQILISGTTEVVEDRAAADARLEILRNIRGREILSLSSAGKVREYQLQQTITFRVVDRSGRELLPATMVSARREYNFDDSQVIAKQQEEALLFNDMESDLLQQMMRRLAAVSA